MSSIAYAIVLITAERDARQADIAALTKQVEGLDTAIAALQAIDDRAKPAPVAEPEKSAPVAADPPKSIAGIAASIGGTDMPVSERTVETGGIAETLAAEILADLPDLMETYPSGPSVRDLVIHYGTNDPRARMACKYLRDTGRALFDRDDETNIQRLRPCAKQVAA